MRLRPGTTPGRSATRSARPEERHSEKDPEIRTALICQSQSTARWRRTQHSRPRALVHAVAAGRGLPRPEEPLGRPGSARVRPVPVPREPRGRGCARSALQGRHADARARRGARSPPRAEERVPGDLAQRCPPVGRALRALARAARSATVAPETPSAPNVASHGPTDSGARRRPRRLRGAPARRHDCRCGRSRRRAETLAPPYVSPRVYGRVVT